MEQELQALKRASDIADPTSYPWLTYLWVITLSAWGGMLRYLHSIRGQQIPWRSILFELFLNISTSCFVGILTFYLCEASGITGLWGVVCVAVSAHMGTEGLKFLRGIARLKLGDPGL